MRGAEKTSPPSFLIKDMAKLKDQPDNTTQTQDEKVTKDVQTTEEILKTLENVDISENAGSPQKEEKEEAVVVNKDEKTDKNSVKKNETASKSKKSIEPHIDFVLKAFPSYEKLYIDAKGGAFPNGTAENIRGSAKLYTNPHFKS